MRRKVRSDTIDAARSMPLRPRRRRARLPLVAQLAVVAALIGPSGQAQGATFPGSVILGRPTDRSVTLNAVPDESLDLYVEYGRTDAAFDRQSERASVAAYAPYEVVLEGLEANRSYRYRTRYRRAGAADFETGATNVFHTQRPPGSPFTFVIQADSHLDEQSDLEVYRQTLRNMAADAPDFLIDLGDTFFSDKVAKTEPEVIGRHMLQRPLLGTVAASAPLFIALGNHEGEAGSTLNGTADNLAIWATRARQRFYPNPSPDGFYSGDSVDEPFVGLREDYYAWEWGDALFVVLDPFWNTRVRPQRAGTNWAWTLGETQYRWLVRTLEGSRARFKFVFAHNLVGGVGFEGRGGVEGAPFYEWGGRNPDGSWGFDAQRPGWGRPIHQIFVDTGVTAWFHGHDHLFVKQELDGIVYQEVPQPSHPRGGTNQATEPAYQYLSGVLLGSSGHLRLRVSADATTVEYVRAFRPDDARNAARNGTVDYRYTMARRGAPGAPTIAPSTAEPPTAAPSSTATGATPGPAPASTSTPAPTGPLPGPTMRLYVPHLTR